MQPEVVVLPDVYQGIPIPESLRRIEYGSFMPGHIERVAAYYARTDVDGEPVTREDVRKYVADKGFLATLMEEHKPRKSGEPYLSHTVAVVDGLLRDAETYGVRYVPAVLRIGDGHDHLEDLPGSWDRVEARFGRNSREVKGIRALSKIKSSQLGRLPVIDQHMYLLNPVMRTFANDFICVRIKGEDGYHNGRTLEHMSAVQRRNTSERNRRILVPLMDEANLIPLMHEIDNWAVFFQDREGFDRAQDVLQQVRQLQIDETIEARFGEFYRRVSNGMLTLFRYEPAHIAAIYDAMKLSPNHVASPMGYYHPRVTLIATNGARRRFFQRHVPKSCHVEQYENECIAHDYLFPGNVRGTLSIIDEAFVWAKKPISVLEASQLPQNQRDKRRLRLRMGQAINRQIHGDEVDFARSFTDMRGKRAKRVIVTVDGKQHRLLVPQAATLLDALAAALDTEALHKVRRIQVGGRDEQDVTSIPTDLSKVRVEGSDEPYYFADIGMISPHQTPPARNFVRARYAKMHAEGRLTDEQLARLTEHGLDRLRRQLGRHFELPEGMNENLQKLVAEYALDLKQSVADVMVFYALCTNRVVLSEITERFMAYAKSACSEHLEATA